MIEWYKRFLAKYREWRGFPRHKVWNWIDKRYYWVGDIAPPSLLEAQRKGNIGGFIRIDPETNRILEIFIP